MASRKTCDKCGHWSPPEPTHGQFYTTAGSCALIGDTNTLDRDKPFPADRVYGWDYESYRAGAYVGPKFGCIHWVAKAPKETK